MVTVTTFAVRKAPFAVIPLEFCSPGSSAEPPPLVAFAAVCAKVNVVELGTEATVNAPLKLLSATPVMSTVCPVMSPCGAMVVMVTTFPARTAPVGAAAIARERRPPRLTIESDPTPPPGETRAQFRRGSTATWGVVPSPTVTAPTTAGGLEVKSMMEATLVPCAGATGW